MMSGFLKNRKQRHLQICLNRKLQVESGQTGMRHIELPHRSLPVTDVNKVSLEVDFLGYRLKMPLMISCMTGGSDKGRRLNKLLARVAGESGIAIGTGSIRVMLKYPETRSHFLLKALAPDLPVLANIGAAQLGEWDHKKLIEAVKSIEADGLYVHLNSAQELFQDGGNRNFSGWYDELYRLLDQVDFPVLVKETGAGIPPVEGIRLLRAGISYVDVAGRGGTDWVAVETLRKSKKHIVANNALRNWGYPTSELLLAYRRISRDGGDMSRAVNGNIIASGGLRTARDFAVALACGARLGAAALPFIRYAAEEGAKGVHAYIASLERGLKAAVILSGARSLDDFRKVDLRIPAEMLRRSEILVEECIRAEEAHMKVKKR